MTSPFKYSLSAPQQILNTASKHLNSCALFVDQQAYTYQQLSDDIQQLASFFIENNIKETSIAVYATRNYESYVASIAIMLSSNRYVPLNPKFPVEKNAKICQLSEIKYLFHGKHHSESLDDLITILNPKPIILKNFENDTPSSSDNTMDWNKEAYKIDAKKLEKIKSLAQPDQIAYILFTSGSTGTPKGVPITHKNLASYIHNVASFTTLDHNDRCTQMFDLTFDLSIHDIFVTLNNSASLYVVPDQSVTAPAKFIKEHKITHWFSVPSVISFMKTFKMLKENSFPNLKLSLFCGEALSVDNVKSWEIACPHSEIINIYGPTEATIGITYFKWESSFNDLEFEKDIVPIGHAFSHQEARVMDKALNIQKENESGELYLAGDQLSQGYWKSSEITDQVFIHDKMTQKTWYKTGDIAKYTEYGLCYLGRLDSQVKICGFRVELGEVESTIKKVSGAEFVCAFSTPLKDENATGLEIFISNHEFSTLELLSLCKKALPSYMVPKKIHLRQAFPFNSNGKIDRPALLKVLEKEYVN